jgi:hypothetical protein
MERIKSLSKQALLSPFSFPHILPRFVNGDCGSHDFSFLTLVSWPELSSFLVHSVDLGFQAVVKRAMGFHMV